MVWSHRPEVYVQFYLVCFTKSQRKLGREGSAVFVEGFVFILRLWGLKSGYYSEKRVI